MASPSTIATSSIVWCSSMSRSPRASTSSATPPWWAICASMWSRKRSPVEIPSPQLLLSAFPLSSFLSSLLLSLILLLSFPSSRFLLSPFLPSLLLLLPFQTSLFHSPAGFFAPARSLLVMSSVCERMPFVVFPVSARLSSGPLSAPVPTRFPVSVPLSGAPPVSAAGRSAETPPNPLPSRSSRTVIRVSRVSRVTTTRRSPRRMYSAISAHESLISTQASSAPASRSIRRPAVSCANRIPRAPRLRASRMSVARSPTT